MYMFVIFRTHLVPDVVEEDTLKDVYYDSIRKNNILMTSVDMNYFLRKTYRKENYWSEKTVTIEIEDESIFINSCCSESMDSLWKEPNREKSEDCNKVVQGRISWKRNRCSICLGTSMPQYLVQPCKCVFHYHCIQKAIQYSDRCPLCQETINITEDNRKSNATTET